MGIFTDTYIKGLKPKAKRYEEYEGGGFGIRVAPTGVKSWVYRYKMEGKTDKLTLGHYPALSLANAKKKFLELSGQRREQKNPKELIKQQKAEIEKKKNSTIKKLAERHSNLHPICADLDGFDIPENRYSLILNIRFLNRRLFPYIRDGLVAGGVLIFETYLYSPAAEETDPMCRDYLLRSNELLHAFLPLKILYYREGSSEKEGETRCWMRDTRYGIRREPNVRTEHRESSIENQEFIGP